MSKWMSLVMKTKRAHRGMSLSQAMKMAKRLYKKRGGGDGPEVATGPSVGARRRTRRGGALSPLPLGGRRRKTRKYGLF